MRRVLWWEKALAVEGWMPQEELAFLFAIALSLPAGAQLLEVGSWKGRSTLAFCAGLRGRGRVTAVDSFRGDAETGEAVDVESAFRTNTDAYRDMLDVIVSESLEAAKQFRDGTFDCVFIDAAHDYRNVQSDIRAWAPKVKPGGLLCGHDYGKFGLSLAVHQMFGRTCHWRSIWYTTDPPRRHLRYEIEARTRMILGRL